MRFSKFAAACAAFALLLARPSLGDESTAPPSSAAGQSAVAQPNEQEKPEAQKDPEAIVCKKEGVQTGTRLARKDGKCLTQREWDEIANSARENAERAQEQSSVTTGP